jgi:DNA-binding SARP family transcriptional activator/TolB-like protein
MRGAGWDEMSDRGLQLRIVGPVSVVRDGAGVALPRSRKVLALLAFLALEGTPQSRSRLCDLFWDVPNDPRGELRWCLSKLRAIVDAPDRKRVVTTGNTLVALDMSDAFVDAIELERIAKGGLSALTSERLAEVSALFRGDVLEGVDVDGSAELTTWLMACRQRYRAMRVAVASELAMRPAGSADEVRRRIDAWLQLAPFDRRAHEVMLETLLHEERLHEAEQHVASAIRAFEQEGLDWSSLRAWWHATRQKATEPARVAVVSEPRAPAPVAPRTGRRASVAVMPFVDVASTATSSSQLAHGLTDDIITRLAKLRALFVIARGTTYALGDRGIDAQEAGRILGVEYVASGRVRRDRASGRASVIVELAETHDARIIWTDELVLDGEGTFGVLDALVDRIVATIAEEIETAECHRAILKPPSSLDAWEAYHRGLWHMYKFTGPDNREAEQFFESARALDPTFARAHAGLSFTHFQNVFLELTPDRDRQMALAYETAAASVATDDRDPAAHWAMGRALWLRGGKGESVSELQRSIELSPNFALGHYTLGFVEAQSGDPRLAIEATNTSRQLSPFDPLQFGMLGSRALAHVRLGESAEAVEWALRAIGRPNAHAHIVAIAASTLALVNRRDEARALVGRIREKIPGYDVERFLRAFRFDRDAEGLLRRSARTIGFDG